MLTRYIGEVFLNSYGGLQKGGMLFSSPFEICSTYFHFTSLLFAYPLCCCLGQVLVS